MKIEAKISKIEKEYAERVRLVCDEQHGHSILTECFAGDDEVIMILKLCHVIRILLGQQVRAKKELKDELDVTLTF